MLGLGESVILVMQTSLWFRGLPTRVFVQKKWCGLHWIALLSFRLRMENCSASISMMRGLVQIPLALTQRDLDGLAKTAHFIERETGAQSPSFLRHTECHWAT